MSDETPTSGRRMTDKEASLLSRQAYWSKADMSAIFADWMRARAAEVEKALDSALAEADRLSNAAERLASNLRAAVNDRDTLRAELAKARATIARLTAAGQVLSEHADRTVGQCSNPDPTTGPTCTERGCEKQACQYPRVKRFDTNYPETP